MLYEVIMSTIKNDTVLNDRNWVNLINLYDFKTKNNDSYSRVISPTLSYNSDKYAWPIFTMIDNCPPAMNEFVDSIDKGIQSGVLPRLILTHPRLYDDQKLSDLFKDKMIRQLDEWTGIYYDTSWGAPFNDAIPNFRTQLVKSEEHINLWHKLLSQFMFKDQQLPLDRLLSDNIVKLLGFEGDTPVATAMMYIDNDDSAGTHMGVVHPDYRIKGYGKKIINDLIVIAIERQRKILFSQSTRRGYKAWTSMGWKETGNLKIYSKL
jgi:GNAT superfamily N-acetyltransferase